MVAISRPCTFFSLVSGEQAHLVPPVLSITRYSHVTPFRQLRRVKCLSMSLLVVRSGDLRAPRQKSKRRVGTQLIYYSTFLEHAMSEFPKILRPKLEKKTSLSRIGMNYMGPEAARSGARMLAPP